MLCNSKLVSVHGDCVHYLAIVLLNDCYLRHLRATLDCHSCAVVRLVLLCSKVVVVRTGEGVRA